MTAEEPDTPRVEPSNEESLLDVVGHREETSPGHFVEHDIRLAFTTDDPWHPARVECTGCGVLFDRVVEAQ